MRILLVNLIFTLLISANSEIIDTKIVNGVEYNIVKSKADVMASYNADGSKFLGKDLVFRNLNGKISVSDVSQKELEKYNIGDSVTIFFAVAKEEKDKQFYKIYFNKEDIIFGLEAVSHVVGFHENIDENKISTKFIYSLVSKSPIVKLVYKDNSYQYISSVSNIKIFFVFAFIVVIVFLFLITLNLGGVLIGLGMLGMMYLMLIVIPNSEKKVFDMDTNEFYSGDTEEVRMYNDYIKFDNIYAFQILKSRECDIINRGEVGEDEECYDAYSLNIVLKDYTRHNLVAHGDYAIILDDAKILSQALNKPILNQINEK